jgi:hypothetical protein
MRPDTHDAALLERVKLELGLDEQQRAGDHTGVVTEQEAPRAITAAQPQTFRTLSVGISSSRPSLRAPLENAYPISAPSALDQYLEMPVRDTSTSAPGLRFANRFSGLATSVIAVPIRFPLHAAKASILPWRVLRVRYFPWFRRVEAET